MTATTATLGYGTTIGYSAYPTPTTYTPIAQVMDIKGPSESVKKVDVTNNNSPLATREYIPGLADPGEVTFDLVYSTAIATAVYGLLRTMKTFEVTAPDTHTWVFSGFIDKIDFGSPVDDKEILSVSICCAGSIIYT